MSKTWLKIIICMCLTVFLCSCKDNEDEIIRQAERIKYARSIKENYPLKNKKTIILNDEFQKEEEITIFEFEGCEYIMYQKYIKSNWGLLGLTHKGNCKYCNKNIKNN